MRLRITGKAKQGMLTASIFFFKLKKSLVTTITMKNTTGYCVIYNYITRENKVVPKYLVQEK